MKFIELRFRNFISFGNAWTSYEFEEGITRLAGANGKGKSAIVDAIWFALFGKPYRIKIKIDQLINSINKKDLQIELYLEVGEDKVRIERGLKPNYFRVFRNDILVPLEAGKRGYQQVLEEEILHFNENIANQIIIKSLTRNISFLSLPKAEKRQIVEGIFDIEIFSVMNKLAKTKVDEKDDRLFEIRKDIQATELLYNQELKNLEKLKTVRKQMLEDMTRKVSEGDIRVKELQEENEKYNLGLTKIVTYKEKLASVSETRQIKKIELQKLRENIASLKAEDDLNSKKIDLFKEFCPTCSKIQSITENISETNNQNIIHMKEAHIDGLTEDIKKIDILIKKYNEIIYNENFLNSNIEKNDRLIQDIYDRATKEQQKLVDIDETFLIECKNKRVKLEGDYNKTAAEKKHYGVLRMLLSDDGIKAFIIKRYLPTINKLLNTYLQKFNSDILFYFDSEFNEVIGTRYKEDFNYFSFSEGQKRRIDLAIMFTFAEFSLHKNRKASTNLLVLDEITAGCDSIAENALYDILKDIVKKEGKEIITISHSMSIDGDKIDRLFNIDIEQGFSKILPAEN